MNRASIVTAVTLFAAVSFAQIRGVPPSVTSYTGGAPNGVPASVTSLGPNGYSTAPCTQPGCGNAFFFYPIGTTPATIAQPVNGGHHHGGGNSEHHHNGNGGNYGGGYVYVPYAYPVPVAVEPEQPEPDEPEPPAPTVFERRPVIQPQTQTRYVEREPATSEPATEAEPQHHNMSPVSDEKIPVVVVYKDGRQQEIANGNYAIVGDMLYDLSGPIAKKIKLTDIDLAETVKQNEQSGVEFSVPAALKPQI